MGLFEISGCSGVQTMIRISTKIGWSPFCPSTYSQKKTRNDTSQTVDAGLLTKKRHTGKTATNRQTNILSENEIFRK